MGASDSQITTVQDGQSRKEKISKTQEHYETPRGDIVDYLRTIDSLAYGQCKLMQHRGNKKLFVFVEKMTQDRQEFDVICREVDKRMKFTLGQLVRWEESRRWNESAYCSSFYRIQVSLEWFSISLFNQMEQREINSSHFEEKDILLMIDSVTSALIQLQSEGVKHGTIQPKTILYDSEDGSYKLTDVQFFHNGVNEYLRFFQGHQEECFLSPQLFDALGHRQIAPEHDPPKSDIFSLGLTALQMATMKPILNIYNFEDFTINPLLIKEHLQEMSHLYSETLEQILSYMLQIKESERPDLTQLGHYLSVVSKQSASLNLNKSANASIAPIQSQEKALHDNLVQSNQFFGPSQSDSKKNQVSQEVAQDIPDKPSPHQNERGSLLLSQDPFQKGFEKEKAMVSALVNSQPNEDWVGDHQINTSQSNRMNKRVFFALLPITKRIYLFYKQSASSPNDNVKKPPHSTRIRSVSQFPTRSQEGPKDESEMMPSPRMNEEVNSPLNSKRPMNPSNFITFEQNRGRESPSHASQRSTSQQLISPHKQKDQENNYPTYNNQRSQGNPPPYNRRASNLSSGHKNLENSKQEIKNNSNANYNKYDNSSNRSFSKQDNPNNNNQNYSKYDNSYNKNSNPNYNKSYNNNQNYNKYDNKNMNSRPSMKGTQNRYSQDNPNYSRREEEMNQHPEQIARSPIRTAFYQSRQDNSRQLKESPPYRNKNNNQNYTPMAYQDNFQSSNSKFDSDMGINGSRADMSMLNNYPIYDIHIEPTLQQPNDRDSNMQNPFDYLHQRVNQIDHTLNSSQRKPNDGNNQNQSNSNKYQNPKIPYKQQKTGQLYSQQYNPQQTIQQSMPQIHQQTQHNNMMSYPPPQYPPQYPPPQHQQYNRQQYNPPQNQQSYIPPQSQQSYIPPQNHQSYIPPQQYIPSQSQQSYIPPQSQQSYIPPQSQQSYIPPQNQQYTPQQNQYYNQSSSQQSSDQFNYQPDSQYNPPISPFHSNNHSYFKYS